MKNYYEILKIDNNVDEEKIINAYNFLISQFNNLPFLTEQMINEIKNLKEAKYILTSRERRIVYDRKLNSINKYNNIPEYIDNTKICNRLFSLPFTRK